MNRIGMRGIVASDFSQNIIKQMKERTKKMKLQGIEYKEVTNNLLLFSYPTQLFLIQADLFDIKNEKKESFNIIIDKGTLDAIASSKEEDNKKQV